jgi:hypothetical protein
MYTTLDWVALGIWIFVILVVVYGIIAIHDIPASVARKRNHPHTDAIEAAGWVSLFMLHALWPFLWIWAFYYKPERESEKIAEDERLQSELGEVKARLAALESAHGSNHEPKRVSSTTQPQEEEV